MIDGLMLGTLICFLLGGFCPDGVAEAVTESGFVSQPHCSERSTFSTMGVAPLGLSAHPGT